MICTYIQELSNLEINFLGLVGFPITFVISNFKISELYVLCVKFRVLGKLKM